MSHEPRTLWTEEKVKERILEAVEALGIERMPMGKEIKAYYESEALCVAIARFGGVEKFSRLLGLPLHKSQKGNFSKKKEQLCWECKYATGGCEWSSRLEPVPGWKAKPAPQNIFQNGEMYIRNGYSIKSCPKFERG